MIPYSEMKTQVSRLAQKADSVYLTKIGDWLQQSYDNVLRRFPWPQLIKTTTVVSTSSVETMILPKDVEFLIQIQDRTNQVVLAPSDPNTGARTMLAVQNQGSVPTTYWVEEDTVSSQPTSSSLLSFSSSSSSDTAQTVRVWGISGSQEISEQITLSGTGTVSSQNSYTRIDRVSKSATTSGTVTITSNSGAVSIATISPREYTSRYTKLHLVPMPNAAITYNITYKAKTPRLQFDEDIPILPCHTALIYGAYAQALEEQRQFTKAQMEWQKFESSVALLVDQFERQRENVPVFVPNIQPLALDIPGNRGAF